MRTYLHFILAVVARVRDFILRHPDVLNDRTRFVEGWGWDHTAWPAEVFPHFVRHRTYATNWRNFALTVT